MISYHQYDELLTGYLLEELDADGISRAEQWIDESPQHRQYFEELRKTYQLSSLKHTGNVYATDEDWQKFKQALTVINPADYTDSEPYEAPIVEMEGRPAINRKKYIRVALTVAASVICILVLWRLSVVSTNQMDKGDNKVSRLEKPGTAPTGSLKEETNESGKPKTIHLSDGTVVLLAEKSIIRFPETFTGSTRNITLRGKAYFTVAKDKSKPFTVWSSDIATTVLGTRFIVTAYPGQQHISVQLLEGSVLVKSGDSIKPALKKNFFLVPGQKLVYDRISATARITHFSRLRQADSNYISESGLVNDNPAIPVDAKAPWYMFNNQSLPDVLEQLKVIYNTTIDYNKKDLQHMYFIGKFNKSDSLQIILKQICTLNNLKLVNRDKKYIISK